MTGLLLQVSFFVLLLCYWTETSIRNKRTNRSATLAAPPPWRPRPRPPLSFHRCLKIVTRFSVRLLAAWVFKSKQVAMVTNTPFVRRKGIWGAVACARTPEQKVLLGQEEDPGNYRQQRDSTWAQVVSEARRRGSGPELPQEIISFFQMVLMGNRLLMPGVKRTHIFWLHTNGLSGLLRSETPVKERSEYKR